MWPYTSGVVLYGLKTQNSTKATYCDHSHLYSFTYDTIIKASKVDQEQTLDVFGWNMVGIPNLCSVSDLTSVGFPIEEGEVYETSHDTFAMICGYYLQYEWQGNRNVFFEIKNNDGVGLLGISFWNLGFTVFVVGTLI